MLKYPNKETVINFFKKHWVKVLLVVCIVVVFFLGRASVPRADNAEQKLILNQLELIIEEQNKTINIVEQRLSQFNKSIETIAKELELRKDVTVGDLSDSAENLGFKKKDKTTSEVVQ